MIALLFFKQRDSVSETSSEGVSHFEHFMLHRRGLGFFFRHAFSHVHDDIIISISTNCGMATFFLSLCFSRSEISLGGAQALESWERGRNSRK
jgi:hypothetical protein